MRWLAALGLIVSGCSSGGGFVPRRDGGTLDFAGPQNDLAGSDLAQGAGCLDGKQDGNETDVDCGGGSCGPCVNGRKCLGPPDCQSNNCSGGFCAPNNNPSCTNGVRDGSETDVDCGGGSCPQCGNGRSCFQPSDCQSNNCQNGFCSQGATCFDGVKNGNESDVDCGGGACPACSNGLACFNSNDCQSLTCSNGLCCGSSTLNCDGQSFNGCEVFPQSDSSNCGSCFNVCGGNQTCQNGGCVGGGNFTHSDGLGDSWSDATALNTFTQAEALVACTTYVQDHGLNFTCMDCGNGCNAGADPCVYYDDTVNTPFTWFYGAGVMHGQVTADCCGCAVSGNWN
jgi:hypothetical protein